MECFRLTAIVMLVLVSAGTHAQSPSNSTDSLTSILDRAQGLIDVANRIADIGERVTAPSYLAGIGAAMAGAASAVVVVFVAGFVFGRHMANVHNCCGAGYSVDSGAHSVDMQSATTPA